MRDVQKLRDLLERVEKASGPDRDIDRTIAMLFGRMNGNVPVCAGYVGNGSFTSSIDAAVRLVAEVLPRWSRSVDATAPEMGISVTLYDPGNKDFTGDHTSEPIATIIACLRALISQAEGEGA